MNCTIFSRERPNNWSSFSVKVWSYPEWVEKKCHESTCSKHTKLTSVLRAVFHVIVVRCSDNVAMSVDCRVINRNWLPGLPASQRKIIRSVKQNYRLQSNVYWTVHLQPATRALLKAQPHQISNTQRTENKTTHVIIQQHSRKLLMTDILMPETFWAHKSEIKLQVTSSWSFILQKLSFFAKVII